MKKINFIGFGVLSVGLLSATVTYSRTDRPNQGGHVAGVVKTQCITHDVGNMLLTVTNWGVFGAGSGTNKFCPGRPSAEFPSGSNVEYIFGGYLWIGAIVDDDTIVATGCEGWNVADEEGSDFYEMYPSDGDEDTIWLASIRHGNVPNRKGVDDDLDWGGSSAADTARDDIGYQWVNPSYPQDWNDCGRDGICPEDTLIYPGLVYPGPDPDGSEKDGVWQPGEGTKGNLRPDIGEPNVDEEFLNGKDDDGDGLIDEDYAAISEEDYISEYSDTVGFPHAPVHIPIGVAVRVSSYAWSFSYAQDFVILDYWIKNINPEPLEGVYVGLNMDADVGHTSISGYHVDDITGFVEWAAGGPGGDSTLVNAAWIADNDGDGGLTPGTSGARLLFAGGRDVTEKGLISFNWWISHNDFDKDIGAWNPDNENDRKLLEIQQRQFPQDTIPGTPLDDVAKYLLMSNGQFDPDQEDVLSQDTTDTRYLFSFGPVENVPGGGLPPGDSVRVVVAYMGAERFHEPPFTEVWRSDEPHPPPRHNFSDFTLNSFWAQFMFDNPGWSTARQAPAPTAVGSDWYNAYQIKFASLKGGDFLFGDSLPDFAGPPPPPSPSLIIDAGRDRVNLTWENSPESAFDPFILALTGDADLANDFEGYRIYRSYTGLVADFHQIGEYDQVNGFGLDLGFNTLNPDTTISGNDTLIDYHFDDIPGRPFYPVFYAVTSFDKGFVKVDTVTGQVQFQVDPLESSVGVNVQRILVSPSVNEVKAKNLKVSVAPNPYRVHASGTGGRYEAEKWEDWDGDGWVEQDRRIQFMNIPARCRIKIFTLDGDLVDEINHDSGNLDPEEMSSTTSVPWNLVSRDLQAIVSGIYLFSCEELDATGKVTDTQVGKFVVIK
jgi:hypothetical protein